MLKRPQPHVRQADLPEPARGSAAAKVGLSPQERLQRLAAHERAHRGVGSGGTRGEQSAIGGEPVGQEIGEEALRVPGAHRLGDVPRQPVAQQRAVAYRVELQLGRVGERRLQQLEVVQEGMAAVDPLVGRLSAQLGRDAERLTVVDQIARQRPPPQRAVEPPREPPLLLPLPPRP